MTVLKNVRPLPSDKGPNNFEIPGVVGSYHLQHSSPLYFDISCISFTAYTETDILKLSVKEITSPLSFDRTNQPLPGGLYDPALGPIDQGDVCAYCVLPYSSCPGHWGHITLPMPVFNPVFFQLLLQVLIFFIFIIYNHSIHVQILRGACIECHRFLFNRDLFALFKLQLEAVTIDRLDIYSELEQVFSTLSDSVERVTRTLDKFDGEDLKEKYSGVTVSEKLHSFFHSSMFFVLSR